MASFAATGEFETYRFTIDRETVGIAGNLEVEINSESFVPAEVTGGADLRKLGVLVDWISVEFQGNAASVVLPAPLQTFHLLATVVGVYLLARWLVSRRGAFLLAIFILATLSLCTAIGRPSLMRHSSWLFVIPALGLTVLEFARLGPRTIKGVALASALALAGAWSLDRFASLLVSSASGPAPDFANNYTGAVLLRRGGLIYDLDALGRGSDKRLRLAE